MQVMAKSNTWRIDESISEAWNATAKSTKKGTLKLQKTYVKKKIGICQTAAVLMPEMLAYIL